MNKLIKRTSTLALATLLSVSAAISASAATTYKDVIEAAKENGVPTRYVSELNNYLAANQDDFKVADFDNMITQMETTYTENLAPAIKELYGENATPETITNDQLIKAFKSLPEETINTITSATTETAKSYGLDVSVQKLDDANYNLYVSKDGNVVIGSRVANKPLSTGDNSSLSVEIASATILALAAIGVITFAKSNRKQEI